MALRGDVLQGYGGSLYQNCTKLFLGNKKASPEKPVKPLFIYGTEGRTRTNMSLRSADFESAVSTISPLRHRGEYSSGVSGRQGLLKPAEKNDVRKK